MDKIDQGPLYYIFLEILKHHHYRIQVLLNEIGVYPGQPPLLFLLEKRDGLSQKDIAIKLGVKPSTITVMLRRVESGNLIIREQDKEDSRVSRVYITDKGREVCRKAKDKVKVINEECFGNFTEEEKITFRRLLMQMRDNLIRANDKK